jgi:uncharacterized cupin superfamily protein
MHNVEKNRAITHSLAQHPIHLGLGAKATVQSSISGMEWYDEYSKQTKADGVEGRLVSSYTFERSWDSWEMHPHGDEVVLCVAGVLVLRQLATDGSETVVTLNPGEYAINPPGIWHTADVDGQVTAIFITAGLGTEHRAR